MSDLAPPEPFNHSNDDAEQALLGAILVRNAQHERVADFLKPEHFHHVAHQRIYAAIEKRITAGKQVDPVTLKDELSADTDLVEFFSESDVTPAGYLARLFASVITIINAEDYARCIVDRFRHREIARITDEARSGKYGEAEEVAAEMAKRLAEIVDTAPGASGPRPIAGALDAAIRRTEAAVDNKGKLIGDTTGLADLDKLLGGLMPAELVILAGRPGMGKSTSAKTIGLASARTGKVIPYFSTEMPADLIGMWFLADITGISADRQRRGALEWDEVERLYDARQELASLPIHIDDDGAQSVAKIRARCLRLKSRGTLGPVVIDHIGHLRASKEAVKQGRTAEITEITRDLLALAKELRTPVLAVSQLNRAVEGRDDKRPSLSDLRDSGSIEQDANTVIFAYREEYYLLRAKPQRKSGEATQRHAAKEADWEEEMNRVRGVCELIVAKNRSGPIDTVRVRFEPERSRVSNLAHWG